MKFSVLMSVYNGEKSSYLKEALNSIISQTLRPDEIVIIKDGKLSKDLNDVIDDFSNRFSNLFRIISFDENKGLGIALRKGVETCKYEWIARMDSDDIAVKSRFEKQINFLKKNPHLDILGTNIYEFNDSINQIIAIKKVPLSMESIIKYSHYRNPFNHMTVIYRKKAVLDAGNYIDFKFHEDYHLWIRMLLNGAKMANLEDCLVNARAGSSLYKRRGGLKYIVYEINLQIYFHKIGFNRTLVMINNIFLRSFVRLLPCAIREKIYLRRLRARSDK